MESSPTPPRKDSTLTTNLPGSTPQTLPPGTYEVQITNADGSRTKIPFVVGTQGLASIQITSRHIATTTSNPYNQDLSKLTETLDSDTLKIKETKEYLPQILPIDRPETFIAILKLRNPNITTKALQLLQLIFNHPKYNTQNRLSTPIGFLINNWTFFTATQCPSSVRTQYLAFWSSYLSCHMRHNESKKYEFKNPPYLKKSFHDLATTLAITLSLYSNKELWQSTSPDEKLAFATLLKTFSRLCHHYFTEIHAYDNNTLITHLQNNILFEDITLELLQSENIELQIQAINALKYLFSIEWRTHWTSTSDVTDFLSKTASTLKTLLLTPQQFIEIRTAISSLILFTRGTENATVKDTLIQPILSQFPLPLFLGANEFKLTSLFYLHELKSPNLCLESEKTNIKHLQDLAENHTTYTTQNKAPEHIPARLQIIFSLFNKHSLQEILNAPKDIQQAGFRTILLFTKIITVHKLNIPVDFLFSPEIAKQILQTPELQAPYLKSCATQHPKTLSQFWKFFLHPDTIQPLLYSANEKLRIHCFTLLNQALHSGLITNTHKALLNTILTPQCLYGKKITEPQPEPKRRSYLVVEKTKPSLQQIIIEFLYRIFIHNKLLTNKTAEKILNHRVTATQNEDGSLTLSLNLPPCILFGDAFRFAQTSILVLEAHHPHTDTNLEEFEIDNIVGNINITKELEKLLKEIDEHPQLPESNKN